MSLLGDLGRRFLDEINPEQLFNFVLSKFPKLKKLLELGQKVIQHFTGVFDAGLHLFKSFEDEISAWRNFREDFRLKSRVVNI